MLVCLLAPKQSQGLHKFSRHYLRQRIRLKKFFIQLFGNNTDEAKKFSKKISSFQIFFTKSG